MGDIAFGRDPIAAVGMLTKIDEPHNAASRGWAAQRTSPSGWSCYGFALVTASLPLINCHKRAQEHQKDTYHGYERPNQ